MNWKEKWLLSAGFAVWLAVFGFSVFLIVQGRSDSQVISGVVTHVDFLPASPSLINVNVTLQGGLRFTCQVWDYKMPLMNAIIPGERYRFEIAGNLILRKVERLE